jgi:hypothetical protein
MSLKMPIPRLRPPAKPAAPAILITHDLRLVDGADQVLVLGETMPGRWSVPAAPGRLALQGLAPTSPVRRCLHR